MPTLTFIDDDDDDDDDDNNNNNNIYSECTQMAVFAHRQTVNNVDLELQQNPT
jgi:hypothetical protein